MDICVGAVTVLDIMRGHIFRAEADIIQPGNAGGHSPPWGADVCSPNGKLVRQTVPVSHKERMRLAPPMLDICYQVICWIYDKRQWWWTRLHIAGLEVLTLKTVIDCKSEPGCTLVLVLYSWKRPLIIVFSRKKLWLGKLNESHPNW